MFRRRTLCCKSLPALVTALAWLATGSALAAAAPATPTAPAANVPTVPEARRDEVFVPFQRSLHFTIAEGSRDSFGEIEVPAGMRLVVEHVSVLVQGPPGQRYFASLRTTVGATGTAWHYLVFSQQYSGGGADVYAASQALRAYADAGALPLRIAVSRGVDEAGDVSVDASVSGHLIIR